MSVHPPSTPARDEPTLLARARRSMARGPELVRAAAVDFALPNDARLNDRLRAALGERITSDVDALVLALRVHAARVLASLGAEDAAASLSRSAPIAGTLPPGILEDAALTAEWLGATRLALLEAGLKSSLAGSGAAGLLVRLAESPEPRIARSASALMMAGSLGCAPRAGELPASVRARLTWRLAATLGRAAPDPRVHLALTDAAEATIAEHEDTAREEALALALVDAIAPRPDALPVLLADALDERRAGLFVALLASASHVGFADARDIVVDRDTGRLALLLHAQALDRAAIARIGVMLAEADSGRDLERFADDLDALDEITPEQAAGLFAPLATHPAYQEALLALGGEP